MSGYIISDKNGDEGTYIGFCIKQKELLKIAQIHLSK